MRWNLMTVRHAAIASIGAMALLLGACGTDESNEKASTSEAPPTTATPTTTVSTTPADNSTPDVSGSDEPAEPDLLASQLKTCPEPKPYDDWYTVPDWTLEGLPDTLTFTNGYTWARPASSEGGVHRWFTLGTVDDGHLSNIVSIENVSSDVYAEITGPDDPGMVTSPTDRVRGQPAALYQQAPARYLPDQTVAEWSEGDLHWTAIAKALTSKQLVEVLNSLELSSDAVTDPAGRYETIASGSDNDLEQMRETELTISEVVDDGNGHRELREHTVMISGRTYPGGFTSEGTIVGSVAGWTLLSTDLLQPYEAVGHDVSLVTIFSLAYPMTNDDPSTTGPGQIEVNPGEAVARAILTALKRRPTDTDASKWPIPLKSGFQYTPARVNQTYGPPLPGGIRICIEP